MIKKQIVYKNKNTQRADDLTAKVERDLRELEARLNKRLQRALDNPLAQQINTCMKDVGINLNHDKRPAPNGGKKKPALKDFMAYQIATQPAKPQPKK